MATRIKLRRDSAANWTANNPILLSGELGIETDTNRFKIGTSLRWNDTTSYAFNVGSPNGVASLGPTGKIPTSQMPDYISISAEVAAALAGISTSNIQEGTNQYFTNSRAISALAPTIATSLTTAATDATTKANSAQSAAIAAAATDATTKANSAQSAAIAAAATDATTKANSAQSAAIAAAATYTDSKTATEVTNRNSAITAAISTEVTNRNSAITTAVASVSGGSTSFTSKTTNDLTEGSSNLYFTNERAVSALNSTLTTRFAAVNGSIDDLSSYLLSTYTNTVASDNKYVAKTGLISSIGTTYVLESGRDVAFGYAGTDDTGKILTSVIPTSIARSADVTSAISTEVTARNSAITTAINTLIDSAPGTLNTLGEIATALAADQSGLTALTTVVNLKAPMASPTFTGTVSGITKSMVGLSNVDNTTDALKPVSTATQTALGLKASLASPSFSGTVDFSAATVTGLASTLPSQLGYTNKYLKTDGTTASWQDIDLTLYLTSALAATTYATLDNAKAYGYHNVSSGTTANKIAYGTSATGYSSISSPAAGDIYIQY